MKKSLLFIHPFLPYPMESGGHQALFNGIRAIYEDYNITLVFQGDNTPETLKNIEAFQSIMPNITLIPLLRGTGIQNKRERLYIRVKNVCHHILQRVKKIMVDHPEEEQERKQAELISYWEYTVAPRDKEWIEHIYNVSREKHYDLVLVEMPWMIKDVFALPKDTKKVHIHHELGFIRRDLEIKSVGKNAFYEVCKEYTDLNEINQLNMYDAVVTLSPVDAKKLTDCGVKVPVYSSFATIDSSTSIVECNNDGKHLTFIGLGNHIPNFVGITWFLENCWKKLKAIDNAYSLDIIGKWNESIITEYTDKYPDVHFLGFVDDLYSAVKDSIMIVPITIGSGIRMKILEAASKGIPFVSTTVGAEGIPVTDGKDCFLADEPDMFIEDILKLQNTNLRNQFARSAHDMVKERYSIKALRQNRLKIFDNLIGN